MATRVNVYSYFQISEINISDIQNKLIRISKIVILDIKKITISDIRK